MTLKHVAFLAFTAAALVCSAALWADPPARVGRVSMIDGRVSFRAGSADEWVRATLNYPLTTGDQLWTGETDQAEIRIGAAAVRLAPATNLSILRLDDESVQLEVSEGSVNIRLRELDAFDSFEVATPGASVELIEPGSYRVDAADDGSTDVVVRSGKVDVASSVTAVRVLSGQEVYVADADSDYLEIASAAPLDDWDIWCLARDRREDRFATSRHVSLFMTGYEDLDEYGSWQTSPEYGICWAPRDLPAGWAPYRYGHWAWIEPWGWSWIDDNAWGFAPFHYGRWAFVARGWVWVPGPLVARPVYAPALVVFIGATGPGPSVGWFPLAPREDYVPAYNASPAYVRRMNNDDRNVERPDSPKANYANRSVERAVTVVPRQAFVSAQPVHREELHSSAAEISRMPITGIDPRLAPKREGVAGRAPVDTPRPPDQSNRPPALVRHAPPPLPAPLAGQPPALTASPPRPDSPKFRLLREPPVARPENPPAPVARPGGPPPAARLQSPPPPVRQSQPLQREIPLRPDNAPAAQAPLRAPGRGEAQALPPRDSGPTTEAPRGDQRAPAAGQPGRNSKARKFVDGHWVQADQNDPARGRN